MAFCKHCGAKLDEGANFCAGCGKKIDGLTNGEENPYAPPKQSAAGFAEDKKNPWQYFTGVFRKYAVFKGRARRAEFWWFTLFNTVISTIISVAELIFDLHIFGDTGLLSTVWSLAVFIPSLSVTVRRMHDCGKSGWFMLIPVYGWIILPCTRGNYGPNSYGPDPITEEDKIV